MMYPKLDVWIKASLNTFVLQNANGYHIYTEPNPRDTSKFQQYVELRSDGPYITQLTKTQWRADVEVNLLLSVILDPKANAYRMQLMTGWFRDLLSQDIAVYKYTDDESYFGCLKLSPIVKGDREVRVSQFGQVDTQSNLEQATVEAHYRLDF